MGNPNNQDLAKYRLERAKEDLGFAIDALEKNQLRVSVNRSYYAIFHSLRAVLALEEVDFKKHSAVIAYFNKNYIKTDKIKHDGLYELISTASFIRNASDYDDFYIVSQQQAKEQVESAKLIINLVDKHIKH